MILASGCSFFRILLEEESTPKPLIFMRGVDSNILQPLITFLYTGAIAMAAMDNHLLWDVLENSRMMCISDLEEEVQEHLVARVAESEEVGEVVATLNYSTELKFPVVERAAIIVLHHLLSQDTMVEGFTSLSTSSLASLLLSFLPPPTAVSLLTSWLEGRQEVLEQEEVEVLESCLVMEVLVNMSSSSLVKLMAMGKWMECGWSVEVVARVGRAIVEKEERGEKRVYN